MSDVTAERIRLGLQLAGTLAILAWIPGNAAKLVAMLVMWGLGFGRISRPEALRPRIGWALSAGAGRS